MQKVCECETSTIYICQDEKDTMYERMKRSEYVVTSQYFCQCVLWTENEVFIFYFTSMA